jgi:thiol-disulfide isomerase/thioredoxin
MLALMLAVTACGASGAQPGSSPAQDDDAVSFGDFTTTDLDGNTVDQSIFAKAKLTMVNIWGTFCDPCISEMPELAEINDELAKDGVQVIGIVVNAQDYEGNLRTEIIETAKEIIELTGADYLHLLPSADLNRIKLDSVMSIPETVFVDSNGNLVGESYVGSRSKDKWLTIINTLLGQVSDELAVVPGCCA